MDHPQHLRLTGAIVRQCSHNVLKFGHKKQKSSVSIQELVIRTPPAEFCTLSRFFLSLPARVKHNKDRFHKWTREEEGTRSPSYLTFFFLSQGTSRTRKVSTRISFCLCVPTLSLFLSRLVFSFLCVLAITENLVPCFTGPWKSKEENEKKTKYLVAQMLQAERTILHWIEFLQKFS